MKKLKFFRYLLRDKIDFIILILSIMFTASYLIKTPEVSSDNFSTGNFSSWIAILCLFILGSCIWTKGVMTDLMSEHIKDPEIRKKLHLDPFELSPLAKIIQIIFFGCLIIMVFAIFAHLLTY